MDTIINTSARLPLKWCQIKSLLEFSDVLSQKWFYLPLGSGQEAEYTLHNYIKFKYVEISRDS